MTVPASDISRQQAMQLMQPAFIRVIDHLRTTLAQSDWKGQYETFQTWPPETSPEVQAEVLYLLDELEAAAESDRPALEDQLAALPQPISVYLLHLTKGEPAKGEPAKGEPAHTLNLWELCYQICFLDYAPQINRTTFAEVPLDTATADHTLLDEASEVDWTKLDLKAAAVVQEAFTALA
ncbi:MAG: hypothetical protein MH252_16545 [Thermosynechococcaceae cyanobacterium MS004]|nr:hypothetical protein [Thermosynechococcaceae cyanobacterium MS004]